MDKKEKQEELKKLDKFVDKKTYKVKYDFYEAKEDISVLGPDKELLGKINKGDGILRVGYGLVVPNLPIETMYFLRYDNLLENKSIEPITDEVIKLGMAEAFEQIIDRINVRVTADVLSHLDIFSEFLVIPDVLKANVKEKFESLIN